MRILINVPVNPYKVSYSKHETDTGIRVLQHKLQFLKNIRFSQNRISPPCDQCSLTK